MPSEALKQEWARKIAALPMSDEGKAKVAVLVGVELQLDHWRKLLGMPIAEPGLDGLLAEYSQAVAEGREPQLD